MLKSVIVAAGLMTGGVFLASTASASEVGVGLTPEAADMIQHAHFGYGGYGGWGRGYGYRGYGRPHYGWGYGGYHRHHHHGWGGYGRGYGWGGRGYF